ncbi:MAG: acyltransferase family protein [Sulfitobacter sp.]
MTQIVSYRPEIDGLRAVAVGSVMLFHANHSWLPGGFVGVDIFFVISGYLITNIIYSELQAGTFTIARFYERRIRRILPALFFVILTCLPVAYALLTPGQLRDFSQSILATAVFSSNIYFYLKTGYFAPDADELPLLHTWSLAVEEQYYIIFPLLMMALMAWRHSAVRPVLWMAMLASFAASLLWGASDRMANFFLLPTRGWELLAGAMLALYAPQISGFFERHPNFRTLAEILGAITLVFGFIFLTGDTIFPGWHAIPIIAAAVLLIAAMTQNSLLGKLLSWRGFVSLGLVSYSAYLWHQPLFAFARLSQQQISNVVLIGLLILTFVLAWVSWRFVERPFRNPQVLCQKQILVGGAIGIAMFGAIGAIGHVTRGLPGRFDAATLALSATAAPSPRRAECHTDGMNYLQPMAACVYGNGPATWAVFGDSHGVELALALSEHTAGAVRHLTFSGCPPALFVKSDSPGCHAWTKQSLAFLEQDTDTKNVILVYRYAQHFAPNPRDPHDHIAELWRSLKSIIERLEATGKTVYLLAPIPELPLHAERYIFGNVRAAAPTKPLGTLEIYHSQMGPILDQLNGFETKVLPVAPVLCADATCDVIRDGTALYFDNNHLSLAGAQLLIDWMFSQDLIPQRSEK